MRGDEDTELIMLERHEERKEPIHKGEWDTLKYDMHRLVNMSADFIYLSLFNDVYCTNKEAYSAL